MEELSQLDIYIQGLNDTEFDTLVSNPTDLAIFINTCNMEVLTKEQLDIINNL